MTTILLLLTLIIGIGTDIYFALDKVHGNTYSEKIRQWAMGRFPFIAFFLGVLMGHFFTFVEYKVPFMISLFGFALIVFIIQLFRIFFTFPKYIPFILLMLGIVYGFFIFPM